MQNNIIEQLKDDSNYYGKFGQQYHLIQIFIAYLKTLENSDTKKKAYPYLRVAIFIRLC